MWGKVFHALELYAKSLEGGQITPWVLILFTVNIGHEHDHVQALSPTVLDMPMSFD